MIQNMAISMGYIYGIYLWDISMGYIYGIYIWLEYMEYLDMIDHTTNNMTMIQNMAIQWNIVEYHGQFKVILDRRLRSTRLLVDDEFERGYLSLSKYTIHSILSTVYYPQYTTHYYPLFPSIFQIGWNRQAVEVVFGRQPMSSKILRKSWDRSQNW